MEVRRTRCRRNERRGRLAGALLVLAGVLSGCGGGDGDETATAHPGTSTVPPPAGGAAPGEAGAIHSPKHAELFEIAKRLRASNETYFGEQTWRDLVAVDTTGMSERELAEHEFKLGWEHYKLGHLDEAEEFFARSHARIPSPGTGFYLGLAQLQTGVRDNCIGLHNPESCVFPLAGGGVHKATSGAERALRTFLVTLENCPRDQWPRVRWFANLAAMALGRHPEALPSRVLIPLEAVASDYDIGRFPDIAPAVGVTRMNLAGGSILEDFDGDGFLDIVTSTCDVFGQLLYFRNNGDGTFSDWTAEGGLLGQLGGLNLVHADYDGDGDRDILVLRGGWMGPYGQIPNSLLRNRGNGTFVDVTNPAGLGEVHYPTQTAAFADYDLDGDLDLFIGNEQPPPAAKLDYPCQLFRNEGGERFVEVTAEAGVENLKLAKGCAWGDYDGDRYPDLYVSNQYDANRLYRNNGDGTFTNVAPELGVDEPVFSFPVWFWDYDNDGRLDLFVAGYGGDMNVFVRSYLRPSPKFGLNALYHNEGGTFRDLAKEAGLTLQTLTMGANWGDLDNDGYPDFYLGTGTPDFDALQPNVMYRNDGHGHFQDVTTSGGFGNIRKGHGIAFGDIDNDGDQDIYLQSGGIYAYDGFFNSLFENPGHGNHWVTLALVGVRSNRDALGAHIRVRIEEGGETRDIHRWVWPAGSFGSSSLQQEIGLGQAARIVFAEVHWPASDTTQVFEDLDLDSFYRITEFEPHAEKLERGRFRVAAGGI